VTQLQQPPVRTPFVDGTSPKAWIFSWPWLKWFQQIFAATASVQRNVVNTKAAYSAKAGDVVLVDTSGGDVVVSFPPAKDSVNAEIRAVKISADVNAMVLRASGADALNGMNQQVFTAQYDNFDGVSDGTSNWCGT